MTSPATDRSAGTATDFDYLSSNAADTSAALEASSLREEDVQRLLDRVVVLVYAGPRGMADRIAVFRDAGVRHVVPWMGVAR
jgi:hypothetical protein